MILKLMSWMPLFDAADGGGGGTAVAEPPAPATPAAPAGGGSTSTPAAPAAPAKGMWSGGLRHQVKLPEPKAEPAAPAPEPKVPPAAPAAGATDQAFEVKDDAGQVLGTFKTQAEAQAFVDSQTKKTAPAPAPAVDPEKLPRIVMGRYNTVKEVEEGLIRSQQEGLRLFNETKTLKEAHQKELATRDSEMQALKAELEQVRTHGSFKELKPEELDVLAKENPRAYTDYMLAKKDRDQALAADKARHEQETRIREERRQRFQKVVVERDEAMRANPADFPGYVDQIPVIQQLVDKTRYDGKNSPFTGFPDSAELFYYAAKGIAAVQAEIKARSVQAEEAEKARLKAAADAAAGRGPEGGGGTAPVFTPPNPDKEYEAKVLAAGATRWLGRKK